MRPGGGSRGWSERLKKGLGEGRERDGVVDVAEIRHRLKPDYVIKLC